MSMPEVNETTDGSEHRLVIVEVYVALTGRDPLHQRLEKCKRLADGWYCGHCWGDRRGADRLHGLRGLLGLSPAVHDVCGECGCEVKMVTRRNLGREEAEKMEGEDRNRP